MYPIDALPFDNTYARLPAAFHTRLAPTPLEGAALAAFNPAVARLIGLDPAEAGRPELVRYLGGERPLPGGDPLAMLYAGHQFGHYVPQLGDGRAILLGEVAGGSGPSWDLHLKGAGRTPYSRSGDGRAVLRSSVREYLCSEAMHGLGIATSRALCLITSTEEVYRERIESGAMLVRVAPSHVRFGSFEVFYHRGRFDELHLLADHVIAHHYPELEGAEDRHPRLFAAVLEGTAALLAGWQAVGFAHGVMNTDNMSMLGLTLDYGPFGFLDAYDAGFVCNHSDHGGRYAFARQPGVAYWNLGRLAQAMLPLFSMDPDTAAGTAYALLDAWEPRFQAHYRERMRRKLGLLEWRGEADDALLERLLGLMQRDQVDWTIFWRRLGTLPAGDGAGGEAPPVRDLFLEREAFDAWAADYRRRLGEDGVPDAARRAAMARANPAYVLRNHLAQTAIERAEEGDFSEVERLLELLRDPYTEQAGMAAYAGFPPDWARRIVVSCSS